MRKRKKSLKSVGVCIVGMLVRADLADGKANGETKFFEYRSFAELPVETMSEALRCGHKIQVHARWGRSSSSELLHPLTMEPTSPAPADAAGWVEAFIASLRDDGGERAGRILRECDLELLI